ncbi:hypothetical protein HPG69_013969 [Diceros bicornis minor]|uniref:Vomeronasal type-1 receptor n=1 Tax=Diceros bicornis minor TaxID=77932 RepID=A0A7J7EMM4_DICBM|nr:hypothetical protein HPG69_013969 [Diceros bicornis minor]
MMHEAHTSYFHAGISGSEDDCQSLGLNRMASRDLAIGMIFSSQTVAGILGNFSVLYFYLFLHYTGCKFRSTDLILKNLTKVDYGYSYAIYDGTITPKLYVTLILCRDGFCLMLIVSASAFMVFFLHKHQQQVRYIHRNNLSPRSSPESTAMQSILVLLCTFVSLWTLSSIFHTFLVASNNPSWCLRNTSTLINACFPTISPYILINYDSRISRVCFAWNRMQNP